MPGSICLALGPHLSPPRRRDPRYQSRSGGGSPWQTCVSKLAKKFYGDAAKYPKIFEANRDQLKDPNLVKPGQKLKIPE